jgi:hypothetical protein
MLPPGARRCPRSGRSLLGVEVRYEPRWVVARTAASEPGAQAAGSRLPPLHRGVRHRGSHRRQSSPRLRIGTTNATSAGVAGVRPGLGFPVNPAADPQRALRGGESEGRHRDRPLPPGILRRGGVVIKGRAAECGAGCRGGVESGTEARGLRECGGRGWGGAGRRGGGRAGKVGEDGLHGERILHDGDDSQPAATAGAGEDVEVEHGCAIKWRGITG